MYLSSSFSILFIFSKKLALGFIDLFYFLNPYSFPLWSLFLLLTLGFLCSFSNSFRWQIKLFEFFFFFFKKAYSIVNFPLKTAFAASDLIASIRLCFHCCLSQGIFWFLWFHCWPAGFLIICLVFTCPFFSFCGWFLISWRSFLQIWLKKRCSASFHLVFCENCSPCRCIIDVFVGVGELHIFLFCHLDPPPLSTS